VTSTGPDGRPSVVTIIGSNPTPFSDAGTTGGTSQFFRNKGAVAGVFLIVGLAAASIVLFLFFFIRKRRRTRRLEHDTAIASTLAAAGYNRGPVDGDDDVRGQMSQQRGSGILSSNPFNATATVSSLPSTVLNHGTGTIGSAHGRSPSVAYAGMEDTSAPVTPAAVGHDFDPYAAYGATTAVASGSANGRRDGYSLARTSSPPPPPGAAPGHQPSYSASSAGHIPRESAGSFEPLLAGFTRTASGGAANTSPPRTPGSDHSNLIASIPNIPPRNPARLTTTESGGSDASARFGSKSAEGDVSAGTSGGPHIRDSGSSVYSAELEDQFDSSLGPLEVRNLPDGVKAGDLSREPSRRIP